MNHSTKFKNLNRSTAHRKSLMNNLFSSYEAHGFVTTTLAKSKMLKAVIQSSQPESKVFVVKLGARRGDRAEMVRLTSEKYSLKLEAPKAKKPKAATKAKSKKTE